MTESDNNQAETGLGDMVAAGQKMMQDFFDYMTAQQSAFKDSSVLKTVSLPDMEDLAGLQKDLIEKQTALWLSMLGRQSGEKTAPVVQVSEKDRRFGSEEWASSPFFDYLRQSYLLNAKFLEEAARKAPIEDGRVKSLMQYWVRQYVEAMAPSNFAATNPDVIKKALETKGESLTRGIQNLLEDLEKGHISMTDESAFEVGRNLAITPGSVIYENEVIQLIQYTPTTDKVYQNPLLMVPPCINKFYVMDLQPENSLVRFVVEQGFTVFLISWKNSGPEDAQVTWEDYLQKGILQSLDVVRTITKVKKPNVFGFCVGGTMLASALAVCKARGEDPVSSMTLMTSFLDFADGGELGCMVDEASVAARELAIGNGGLMKGQELNNVFASLRATDLVWQYVVGNYLKGETPKPFDMLYWNSDPANLPGPYMTYYLRNMYLENNLRVPGKLTMLGEKIDLGKLDMPSYLFGAREDHIVPWRSAYLSRNILGGDPIFVLGASGHIAGAINPASKNRRSYWTNDAKPACPDEWLAGADEHPGSWWLNWIEWLKPFGGKLVAARTRLGSSRYEPIEPAPGRYVKAKAA